MLGGLDQTLMVVFWGVPPCELLDKLCLDEVCFAILDVLPLLKPEGIREELLDTMGEGVGPAIFLQPMTLAFAGKLSLCMLNTGGPLPSRADLDLTCCPPTLGLWIGTPYF